MTACTNNGGSRARRAVTAALVGVLSVGAAPMVALATEAAPVAGDVQLQADADAFFKDGTVNFTDGLEDGASFVYNNTKPQGLVPESVSYKGSTLEDVTSLTCIDGDTSPSTAGHYYAYVRIDSSYQKIGSVTYGEDKTPLRGEFISSMPQNPGDYAVVVFYDNGAGGRSYMNTAATFSIVNQGLEGATLYEGDDVNDTTFAYTGESNCAQWSYIRGTMGVAVDGVKLDSTDYTLGSTITEDGKTEPVTGNLVPGKTYVVTVTGSNGYAGQTAKLKFTYQKMDLTTANVSLVNNGVTTTDVTTSITGLVSEVNGKTPSSYFFDRIDARIVSEPEGGKGVYEIEVAANADDEYVTGKTKVSVIYADGIAAIEYDGDAWSTLSDPYKYDMTDPKATPFDVDKISAVYSGEDVDFEVAVKDAKTGKDASVSSLSERGEWLVTVTAKGSAAGRYVAAVETLTVENYNNVTDSKNVFVTYDGKAITTGTISDTYTGEDLLDKLAVSVEAGDKTFAEGTDYTVEVTTTDQTGKTVKVDSIVDAGTYKVTVKGISFDLGTAGTYTFTVSPRTLTKISPSDAFASEDVYFGTTPIKGTKYYYAYTGEEIAPEFTFVGDDDNTYVVPADEFEVTYKKNVNGTFKSSDLKDEGIYVIDSVTLKSGNFTDASGTIVAASTSDRIEVTSTGSFVDVPNDAWYAEAVATAKQQGYIVGMNGSNFFAPLQNISRADVVCVLYRMAGGTVVNEGLSEEEKSYVSDFEDVDAHAYYAKAVAWARKMGIVNGYGTTFGVSRDITTEEFVTMLARYAAKMGTDTSVDADAVLATVADGDEVTGYAREAVAWAVEQGYVAKDGNLIDPQGNVYRARVVTIAVRYQPEQLHTIL